MAIELTDDGTLDTLPRQLTLTDLVRARYQNAYRRVNTWAEREQARLRSQILVPYFGGCMCRMHNCKLNFENGHNEWPVNGKSHRELARLAARFDYEQEKIWRESNRLKTAFTRYF